MKRKKKTEKIRFEDDIFQKIIMDDEFITKKFQTEKDNLKNDLILENNLLNHIKIIEEKMLFFKDKFERTKNQNIENFLNLRIKNINILNQKYEKIENAHNEFSDLKFKYESSLFQFDELDNEIEILQNNLKNQNEKIFTLNSQILRLKFENKNIFEKINTIQNLENKNLSEILYLKDQLINEQNILTNLNNKIMNESPEFLQYNSLKNNFKNKFLENEEILSSIKKIEIENNNYELIKIPSINYDINLIQEEIYYLHKIFLNLE